MTPSRLTEEEQALFTQVSDPYYHLQQYDIAEDVRLAELARFVDHADPRYHRMAKALIDFIGVNLLATMEEETRAIDRGVNSRLVACAPSPGLSGSLGFSFPARCLQSPRGACRLRSSVASPAMAGFVQSGGLAGSFRRQVGYMMDTQFHDDHISDH